eukprot:6339670-Pyramimonas_sp.AAC.1
MARTAASASRGRPGRRCASRRTSGIALSIALSQSSVSSSSADPCNAQDSSDMRLAKRIASAVPCSGLN